MQPGTIGELVRPLCGLGAANLSVCQRHGVIPPTPDFRTPRNTPTRNWLPRYTLGHNKTKATDFSVACLDFLDRLGCLRIEKWWAQQDSNLRLPPCEGGTLPLSYAPLAWPWEGWAGQVLAYHGGKQVTGYRLQKQPGAGSLEPGAAGRRSWFPTSANRRQIWGTRGSWFQR